MQRIVILTILFLGLIVGLTVYSRLSEMQTECSGKGGVLIKTIYIRKEAIL